MVNRAWYSHLSRLSLLVGTLLHIRSSLDISQMVLVLGLVLRLELQLGQSLNDEDWVLSDRWRVRTPLEELIAKSLTRISAELLGQCDEGHVQNRTGAVSWLEAL